MKGSLKDPCLNFQQVRYFLSLLNLTTQCLPPLLHFFWPNFKASFHRSLSLFPCLHISRSLPVLVLPNKCGSLNTSIQVDNVPRIGTRDRFQSEIMNPVELLSNLYALRQLYGLLQNGEDGFEHINSNNVRTLRII